MTPPRKSAKKPTKATNAGKKPTKGTATGKKRTSRRNKASGISLPLLVAFLAGCLMATFLYWGVTSSSRVASRPGGNVPAAATGKAASGPAKKQSASPGKTSAPRGAVAGKAVTTEKAEPAEATREQVSGTGELSAQTQSEVAKALMDLQNLPYEETFVAPLEERIRQSDYAVVQAVLVAGLPLTALQQEGQTSRTADGETYQLRRFRVYVKGQPAAFENSLRDTLATWTEGASLQKLDPGRLGVFLGKAQTHELALVTAGDAVPKGGSGGAPLDFPQRTRGVGEPASLLLSSMTLAIV